jgi:hypothetical protein
MKYRTEVKWAVIFVVVNLLWMLMEKLTGLHDRYISQHRVYTVFFFIPAVAIYAVALLEKRRKFYGGVMTYGQGVITGLIITVIVAILSPLVLYFTMMLITPDFFRNSVEYAVSKNIMDRDSAETYFSPGNYLLMGFLSTLVVGLVISLIVPIFIRMSRKGFENISTGQ